MARAVALLLGGNHADAEPELAGATMTSVTLLRQEGDDAPTVIDVTARGGGAASVQQGQAAGAATAIRRCFERRRLVLQSGGDAAANHESGRRRRSCICCAEGLRAIICGATYAMWWCYEERTAVLLAVDGGATGRNQDASSKGRRCWKPLAVVLVAPATVGGSTGDGGSQHPGWPMEASAAAGDSTGDSGSQMLQRVAAGDAKVVRPSCKCRVVNATKRGMAATNPGGGASGAQRWCCRRLAGGASSSEWWCYERLVGLLLDGAIGAASNHGGAPAVGSEALVSGLLAGRVRGQAGRESLVRPCESFSGKGGLFSLVRTDTCQLLYPERQGQKLRRLLNLLGCRDPEIMTPSHSRSALPSDPVDQPDSTSDNREDVVSKEAEDGDEVDDNMTLGKYKANKWSVIKLKPRKPRDDRFTLDAYARKPARKARKKAVVESDDEDEVEHRQKIPPRRGGKSKRGRK
ncbi:hypothetical protein ACQ4PT_058872 [Festuca glaucescens]